VATAEQMLVLLTAVQVVPVAQVPQDTVAPQLLTKLPHLFVVHGLLQQAGHVIVFPQETTLPHCEPQVGVQVELLLAT
jgi:hypothetical protein